MGALKGLSTLKASQLKYAAFYTGLQTTGTKAELENLIRQRTQTHDGQSTRTPAKGSRILSIDMGIKNLGICVLSIPQPKKQHHSQKPSSPLKILDWRKVDVLSNLTEQHERLTGIPQQQPSAPNQKPDTSLFRPAVLSLTAFQTAKHLLSAYRPDAILIERQRFRSGGASAVQEWTLRVNMLESMLWACFRTLLPGGDADPNVEEVNPARVAKFWCAAPADVGTRVEAGGGGAGIEHWMREMAFESETKGKIEKKDKIAVVRAWLSHAARQREPEGSSSVSLEFTEETQKVADMFLAENKRGKKQTSGGEGNGTVKLDDLADCLLQGVAWARWEENSRLIGQMISNHRA